MAYTKAPKEYEIDSCVSPLLLLISTFVSILMLCFSDDSSTYLFVLGCLAVGAWTKRSSKPIKLFLKVSLPLAIPIIVTHGVLNPTYPIDLHLFELIPVRKEGLKFAFGIVRQVSILITLSSIWLLASPSELLDWLISRRCPLLLYGTFAQALATIKLMERRGQAIYRAQQARGIKVGPDLLHRLKALPSVVLPVIISALNENERKTFALTSRGFGLNEMSAPLIPLSHKGDPLKISVILLPLFSDTLEWIV